MNNFVPVGERETAYRQNAPGTPFGAMDSFFLVTQPSRRDSGYVCPEFWVAEDANSGIFIRDDVARSKRRGLVTTIVTIFEKHHTPDTTGRERSSMSKVEQGAAKPQKSGTSSRFDAKGSRLQRSGQWNATRRAFRIPSMVAAASRPAI